MIREIQELYTENILIEATNRYGVTKEQVTDLGGFESFVYEYERGGQSYILKITHSIRRTADYIHGELDWLNYLADRGVSVSRAIPSLHGNLVEIIDNGDSYFLAYAFEKAKGELARGDLWNASTFEVWGETMGQMHALTKDYVLPNPAWKRQEWDEEEQLKVEKYIPHDTQVIENTHELINFLRTLPKDCESYGLLHTDFHSKNFFIDNGRITVFDFDDAGYNWFVNDIAISLYYVIWRTVDPEEAQKAAREFLEPFMKGYRKANQLDQAWMKYIPYFLRLRHTLLYGILNQIWDVNNLEDKQRAELERFRKVLVGEQPMVDLDFSTF